MTRDEALALVEEIEGLTATARHDDERVKAGVRAIVTRLRDAPGEHAVIDSKLASIATWTEILFSPERRRVYGGDEEVTALLLHDCERLRDVIRAD